MNNIMYNEYLNLIEKYNFKVDYIKNLIKILKIFDPHLIYIDQNIKIFCSYYTQSLSIKPDISPEGLNYIFHIYIYFHDKNQHKFESIPLSFNIFFDNNFRKLNKIYLNTVYFRTYSLENQCNNFLIFSGVIKKMNNHLQNLIIQKIGI